MAAIGQVSDVAALKARAEAATGLKDFGDPWIFENLGVMIPAMNAESQLSEAGAAGAEEMIVRSLSNRLAHVDLLRRHPEILAEEITVAAVVVGLPRTGSTMLHRMLCAAPGMTGMRWWEAQNYAPPVGTDPHDPEPRRQAAHFILDYMLENAPDLMSIHPMSVDQPDEELIALGQIFSSTLADGQQPNPLLPRPEADAAIAAMAGQKPQGRQMDPEDAGPSDGAGRGAGDLSGRKNRDDPPRPGRHRAELCQHGDGALPHGRLLHR
jgi:hypothetical protein